MVRPLSDCARNGVEGLANRGFVGEVIDVDIGADVYSGRLVVIKHSTSLDQITLSVESYSVSRLCLGSRRTCICRDSIWAVDLRCRARAVENVDGQPNFIGLHNKFQWFDALAMLFFSPAMLLFLPTPPAKFLLNYSKAFSFFLPELLCYLSFLFLFFAPASFQFLS